MHWNWTAFGAAVAIAALAKLITLQRGSFDEKAAAVSVVAIQGAIAGVLTPESLTTAIVMFLCFFHASDALGRAIGYVANRIRIKRGIECQLETVNVQIAQAPRATRLTMPRTARLSTSRRRGRTPLDS